MNKKSLKELKDELEWLEKTPFYMSKDGAPSPLIILFIITTGIIIGLAILLFFKFLKKRRLRKKIKLLEEK